MDFRKATKRELWTVLFDDMATTLDKLLAKQEIERRNNRRVSGKVVNYVR